MNKYAFYRILRVLALLILLESAPTIRAEENFEVLWRSGEVYYPSGEIEVFVEVTHLNWEVFALLEGDPLHSSSFTFDLYIASGNEYHYYDTYATYSGNKIRFTGRGKYRLVFNPRYITFMRCWVRQDLDSPGELLQHTSSINLSSDFIEFGETVSLTGTIKPAPPDLDIRVQFTREGVQEQYYIKTDAEGSYELDFLPEQNGEWWVSVSWYGDNIEYRGGNSVALSFDVGYIQLEIQDVVDPKVSEIFDPVNLMFNFSHNVKETIYIQYNRPDDTTIIHTKILKNKSIDDEILPDQTGIWRVVVLKASGIFGRESIFETSFEVRKKTREITFEVSRSNITINESVVFGGEISSIEESSIVEIYLNGVISGDPDLIIESKDGVFTQEWFPGEAKDYVIIAHLPSTSVYYSIKSLRIPLSVGLIPTYLNCEVSSMNIRKEDNITVSGNLEPIIIFSELPLITLEFSQPDSSTIVDNKHVKLNEDGDFMITYSPEILGHWNVRATWDGDDYYSNTSSTVKSFTCVPYDVSEDNVTSSIAGFPLTGIIIGLVSLCIIERNRNRF
jgi:hypothetical protein